MVVHRHVTRRAPNRGKGNASKLLDSDAVVVERHGRNVSVPRPDDNWMEGLSATDVIRQFGIDPTAI